MPKLKKVSLLELLFLLGIFFLPFNSFDGLDALGEFKRDSCLLFFLLVFIGLFIKGKIRIPVGNPIFQLLWILLLWFVLSVFFNINDMSQYYFKNTSGFSRAIRQLISIIISSVILLITFYNIVSRSNIVSMFYRIRKVFSYSLIVVVIYGTLEYLIINFKTEQLKPVLYAFNYFPFTSVNIDQFTKRISSVTFEAPALATYLTTISGWMFSYILTDKGLKRFIPGIIVILFSLLSGSRAGFFIIIVQVLVFVLYLMKDKKFNKLFVKLFFASLITGASILVFYGNTVYQYAYDEITSFKTDDEVHAISNKTRFGIQYAMFQVFLESPLMGTGYGLQTYESRHKYPNWATKNNWEFRVKHLNESHPSFPPGFNLYLRLLAETGIIGFSLFILFISAIFAWCYNNAFKVRAGDSIIPLVFLISLVGYLINWLKMDTFRIYGFWLVLAFIMAIMLNRKQVINATK